MKKACIILAFFLSFCSALFSQTAIRGTVTNSSDGTPVQGVKVTSEGLLPSLSVTGIDGRYLILIGSKTKELKFAKKNYLSKVVPVSGSFIDVKIEEVKPVSIPIDTTSSQYKLSSINKVEKDSFKVSLVEVGYGLTENRFTTSSVKYLISSTELNPAYQMNINNALAGKVPGLKFYGQSGMALGRTGTIGLRGQAGLSTGQSPVYLVDGTYISDINDINYFEIESVTVLSGPSSSALLGSRAANGAVLITTKRGESQKDKSGIEVNTGVMFSNVYIIPPYQNSYSGGGYPALEKYTYRPGFDPVEWQPLDGKYYHDYSDDASWGPKMAGQEYIPWYSWYPGTKYTGKTSKLLPQTDNVRDFYDTGIRINNSVTFSKSTDDFSVRAAFSNINTRGLIPYTSLDINSFVLRTRYNPVKRLTIEADINFFTTLQKGEINVEYSNATTGSFNSWFHRDLDMGKLKELIDLRSPGGFLSSWNHSNPTVYDPMGPGQFYAGNYWGNPFKYFKSKSVNDRSDRLYGNISISYKLAEWLITEVTYRREQITGWSETKIPVLKYFMLSLNNYNYDRYYATGTSYSNEDNLAALLIINRDIKYFHVDLISGFEVTETVIKTNNANTNHGLIIPDLFTIQNSRDQPTIINGRSDSKSRSGFIRSSVGYKDFLFVDFSLRKEWLSTLPPNNNSLIVKSIGGMLEFSRFLSIPIINSGKIRFAWGETPTSLSVYQYPGVSYGQKWASYGSGFQNWDNNYLMTTPDYLVKSDVRGAIKRQSELGIDMDVMGGRAGFSLTYWWGNELGIPLSLQITPYSGFTSSLMNSGRIEKRGLDFSLGFNAFSTEKISMETRFIVSRLINQKVAKMGENIDRIVVQSLWGGTGPQMVHAVGRDWGSLFGNGMKRDSLGRPFVRTNGSYENDPYVYYGSTIPKVTGGVQNTFRIFKDITVIANIDYQFGGKFFSLSDMWGTFSGLTAETAGLNDKGKPIRDAVADGGGVHVFGVDATPGANYGKPVDYYVEAMDYFHGLYNNKTLDPFVFDMDYIKLRELSISYRFSPKKLVSWIRIPEITVSLYSQNLLMIYAPQRKFDPSELTYTGGEQGQFPSVRSYGGNLKICF